MRKSVMRDVLTLVAKCRVWRTVFAQNRGSLRRMQANREHWFAGRPRAGSVRAAQCFFSFKPLALTAALTFSMAASVHNAHAQKVEENPASPPIAGFELPEGARQDARDPERVFNPQTGQNFVWDAGIQKWIDIKTDHAFNPAYIDQEGKVVRKFALWPESVGRAPPVVEPAVHVGAELESNGNSSFAENFEYYFNGIARHMSGGIQFYTGRDAFRYLLAGELAGTTKFPEMDDWIKSLLAPVDARFATAQSGSSWQVTPALSANLSMADVYQSWWTAPDGKLVSGFLAGTTVGLKLAPDFPIAEKWHWLGYTAAGSLTFSFSDMRLKRDIVELTRLGNGIGLYRYRYSWSDQFYVGVMAQEVAKIVPDAVVRDADGYLRVDYFQLGLKLQTWDEWTASRAAHPNERAEEQPCGGDEPRKIEGVPRRRETRG